MEVIRKYWWILIVFAFCFFSRKTFKRFGVSRRVKKYGLVRSRGQYYRGS